MKEYIESIDKLIESKKIDNIDEVISEHLLKIGFYQHERLIHFLVTMLFTILTFSCFLYTINNVSIAFILLTLILFCLEVPYIFHYYFLENSVQHMYLQHDKLVEIKKNKKLN